MRRNDMVPTGDNFDNDNIQKGLQEVNPHWSSEELLNQQGLFFLKDVAPKLPLTSPELKQMLHELEKDGKSTWKIMGIRRRWTDWVVKMQKFKSFIKSMRYSQLRSVQEEWDANELLSKKGRFYLTDVCEKLPFSTEQLRYKVRKSENPAQEFGISKHPKNNAYVVDMEVFSTWISQFWKGEVSGKTKRARS